jgi:hypothetical protein
MTEAGTSVWRGLTGAGPLRVLDGTATLAIEGTFQVLFLRMVLRKHRPPGLKRRRKTSARRPGP